MDRKSGKKRRNNIGSAQPAYERLKNENRSDIKEEDSRSGKTKKHSRLERKRLLQN